MPSFRLWTFGGLRIEAIGSAVPVSITQRKRLAFLTLLASGGERGIARERLLLLLWPESNAERARGALQQLLYVTRRAFGDGSVVGTSELRLDPDVISSDVGDFQAAVASCDFAGMVRLYHGPFLDAFYLTGAPELERWVEEKRQELARSYQTALSRLATQAIEGHDFAAAIRYAELLTASDLLSGRAMILLMEALAANGDVSVAVDRAKEHAAIVQRELGVDVDPGVARWLSACGSGPLSRRRHQRHPVPAATTEAAPTRRVHSGPAVGACESTRLPGGGARRLWWPRCAPSRLRDSSSIDRRHRYNGSSSSSRILDRPMPTPRSPTLLTQAMRRALSDSRSLGAET